MGEEPVVNNEEADSEDISSDEEQIDIQKQKGAKEDEDSESDFAESDDDKQTGADQLQSNAMDIPRADDIPIISKLAKLSEKEKLAKMDG